MEFDKPKLLISDRALYAIRAGKLIKKYIPNLKHLTCLCHAFHNLTKTIRPDEKNVNVEISYLKRVLTKNRINQGFFIKYSKHPRLNFHY